MMTSHLPAEAFEVPVQGTLLQGNRAETYQLLVKQVERLLDGPKDLLSDLGNVVALLKTTFDFYWIGFYLRDGEALWLRQFQGPVACAQIKMSEGVCGACASRNQPIIVPDVEQFPGHIACSNKSRSEIVLPLRRAGDVVGVLDVDSVKLNDFSLEDQLGLEQVLALIEKKYF